MSDLDLPDTLTVSLPKDRDGMLDRQCPAEGCGRYFKIKLGTGLTGENLPLHCPYCGHASTRTQDFTVDKQIEYAKQVAVQDVADRVTEHLGQMFRGFNRRSSGGFGLRMSLKVTPPARSVIHYDGLGRLETDVVCVNCTLHFAVYGVFAFCPDCRERNSRSILEKNLDLAARTAQVAGQIEDLPAEKMVENALADCVAAFDGFGNEAVRHRAAAATTPARAADLKFQNLTGSLKNVRELFGFDLAAGVTAEEWAFAGRCFQKRHLLAHKMGVVDEKYLAATQDPDAQVGRRIAVTAEEVIRLVDVLRRLGKHLVGSLP